MRRDGYLVEVFLCQLLVALVFAGLVYVAQAASVVVYWDPNPPEDEVTGYHVYQSTNVLGPFDVVATTSGTNATVTNIDQGQYYFYVTASNFWGESRPSETVNTPDLADGVTNTHIKLGIPMPPPLPE